MRGSTRVAVKARNDKETNKTFDLLRCSYSFFKGWIEYNLYDNMTIESYGFVRCIDPCLPKVSVNLLHEKKKENFFKEFNLRPMFCIEENSKEAENTHYSDLLQANEARYFLK